MTGEAKVSLYLARDDSDRRLRRGAQRGDRDLYGSSSSRPQVLAGLTALTDLWTGPAIKRMNDVLRGYLNSRVESSSLSSSVSRACFAVSSVSYAICEILKLYGR
jgi:hypothetical protein